jgi:hypothetical protein
VIVLKSVAMLRVLEVASYAYLCASAAPMSRDESWHPHQLAMWLWDSEESPCFT